MVFIWTRKGGWIFGSLILSFIGLVLLDKYLHLLRPGQDRWVLGVPFVVAGLFSVGLGIQGRLTPPRLMLERATGRELMKRPLHSAYYLSAEYWGALYIAIALWIILANLP